MRSSNKAYRGVEPNGECLLEQGDVIVALVETLEPKAPYEVLLKPFSVVELGAAIHRLLARDTTAIGLMGVALHCGQPG